MHCLRCHANGAKRRAVLNLSQRVSVRRKQWHTELAVYFFRPAAAAEVGVPAMG